MSYTFTEAEAEVRSLLGNRSSDLTTRVTQWLRDAYLGLLSSKHAKHFFAVHAIGTTSYTIITQNPSLTEWTSDDVLFIHTLRDDTNNKIIREKNFQTIIGQAVDADAIPRKYARWGSKLYFNTTPTSSSNQPVSTLYFVQRPSAWTGDNLPSVPEEWQSVIVYAATETGWLALQDKEKRIEFRETKQNAIKAIIHPREFQDDQIEWGMVPTRGPNSEEGLYHGQR